MADICLSLLGNPEIEEKLLDSLLLSPLVRGFASQPAASHGDQPSSLDASEQVLGRADAVLIQVFMAHADTDALLNNLRKTFQGTGLRYWLTPVLTSGEI